MLRVATLNTWKGDGKYNKRLKILAEQLREENIDILCCQEVFYSRSGSYDTAGRLADRLEMSYIFSSARPKKRCLEGKWMESASGLAILTNPELWLHTCGSFPLPSNRRDGGRNAQYAVLRRDGKKILVMNVHLSHVQTAGALRLEQLKTILAHPLMKEEFAAVFLCGDFNAEPDSREIKFLTSGKGEKLEDCYLAGGGDCTGSTLQERVGSRGQNRDARIDYIFSVKTSDCARVKFRNSRTILRPGAEGIIPSDHYCVIVDAEVDVKKRTVQTYRHPAYRNVRSFSRPFSPSSLAGEQFANL